MNSWTNLKSTFSCRYFEVNRKRFVEEIYTNEMSLAQGSFAIDLVYSDFGNFLLLISCRSVRNLCKLTRAMGQVHGDCTVDSAVFHKERLFRCVDDITFLPAGPRYIVNIRAGDAHTFPTKFSERIVTLT